MADATKQSASGAAPLRIFLIAVEESADRLGAALMAALQEGLGARPVEFVGIGGNAMVAAGLDQRYQVEGLGFMGFITIPRSALSILRQIREAAAAVVSARPDVLVIIDSPEFTHRVARRVRALAPAIPIVDYVCPSVWAWRPGRARAMRGYVEHVLALLPFEPEVMARLGGPPCTHVGHPIGEHARALTPTPEDVRRREASPPVVLVLPGSRPRELRALIEPFGAAIKLMAARHGAIEVVVPTLPHLRAHIEAATANWRPRPRVIVELAEHHAAFRSARAALAASGTVTLELALAGVPTVVAYRGSWLEYIVYRAMVRVPSVVLANLVLGENVMPEILQYDITPERLATALRPLLSDTPERRAQVDALARTGAIMDTAGSRPSVKAAAIVLNVAARAHR